MSNRNNTHKYPQVLLLGNGLNQAFDGKSWNDFLKDISTKKEIVDNKMKVEDINCSEPLKAIIVTDDHVDLAMKKYCKDIMSRSIDEGLADILKEILTFGFDEILTTNYTYEIEKAAVYPKFISENIIKKMMRHTSATKRSETKYLLHTYNEVNANLYTNRIWHIHGEARKPDSTVLGHYYYGNLMYKIKKELEYGGKYLKAEKSGEVLNLQSWIDAFIMGDIYVLGFGFGLSEFDLWWLLNRKAREKANTGKIYFYEPKPVGYSEKHNLLNLMHRVSDNQPLVEILDCGFKMISNSEEKEVLDGSYKDFYVAVLNDIENKMNSKKMDRSEFYEQNIK